MCDDPSLLLLFKPQGHTSLQQHCVAFYWKLDPFNQKISVVCIVLSYLDWHIVPELDGSWKSEGMRIWYHRRSAASHRKHRWTQGPSSWPPQHAGGSPWCIHTHPTHTPGGAQQDRQHPSWERDRWEIRAPAEREGRGVMGKEEKQKDESAWKRKGTFKLVSIYLHHYQLSIQLHILSQLKKYAL